MVILLSQYMGSSHGFSLPLKDRLGSNVRVGYYILVPDFYLVLHGLRCKKTQYWINHKSSKMHLLTYSCQKMYKDL